MNSAPSQTPVPSVPKASPVNSPLSPAPTPVDNTEPTSNPPINSVVSSPIPDQQSTISNIPPPVSPPPFVPPSGTQGKPPETVSIPPPPSPKKFPFMMVTFILVIILAGFVGSFLFFSYSVKNTVKIPPQTVVPPPVILTPTQPSANSLFATPSGDLDINPFASPTAEVNPFGTYQNPFTTATSSSQSSQQYQNPFANQK